MRVFPWVPGRRLMLLVLALAALMPFASTQTVEAEDQENGPIAEAALRTLDTWGGQCWTWMQQIVQEATGRQVGYDYRLGFFEAGAYEVSAEEAQNGDIIQVGNDDDTSPWSYYPGQHTLIILKNLGEGRFDGIDSNQNWDEWVRLRTNYDPYAAAARSGLDVHIYRIPGGGPGSAASGGGSASPGNGDVPSGGVSIGAGEAANVAADGGCLNLRTSPSLSGERIGCLPSGTSVTVTGASIAADGYTWVPVNTPAGDGWVASNYLVRTAAPATPAPAAAHVEEAAPVEEPPAAELTARTDDSPGCLRVRNSSGLDSGILDCLPAGMEVTLGSEAEVTADGYSWVRVRIPGRVEGWVASEFLIR